MNESAPPEPSVRPSIIRSPKNAKRRGCSLLPRNSRTASPPSRVSPGAAPPSIVTLRSSSIVDANAMVCPARAGSKPMTASAGASCTAARSDPGPSSAAEVTTIVGRSGGGRPPASGSKSAGGTPEQLGPGLAPPVSSVPVSSVPVSPVDPAPVPSLSELDVVVTPSVVPGPVPPVVGVPGSPPLLASLAAVPASASPDPFAPEQERDATSNKQGVLDRVRGDGIARGYTRLASSFTRAVERCAVSSSGADRGRPSYHVIVDQPPMTAIMGIELCRGRSPSFDKLCHELEARR